MGKKSRDKGARGELAARDEVRRWWHAPRCIRAAQAAGAFACDLLYALTGAHIEVKWYAKIGAFRFLEQAEADAGDDEFPVLLLRENDRKQWLVAFRIEDTARFVEAYLANQEAQCGQRDQPGPEEVNSVQPQ